MRTVALGALVLLLAVAAALVLRSEGEGDAAAPGTGDTPQELTAAPTATPNETAPIPAAGAEPVRVERVPVPVTPSPNAVAQGVRGRAVDPRGTPVPGAVAWLVENAGVEPMSRMLAQHRGVPLPPVARAVTGPDGAFELGMPTPTQKAHDVLVTSPSHADTRIEGLRVQAGAWHDLGSVELAPGTTVRGRVTIEGTELPVPHATVAVASASTFDDGVPGREGGLTATADAGGFYELRNAPRQGLFALTAQAPGFARVTKQNVQFSSGAPVQVDFQLPRGLSISGVISDAAGQPIEGARVDAIAANEQPFRGADLGEGRFEVHGLRDGNYELRVRSQTHRPFAEANVPAGRSGLRIVLQPRATASVRVLAPDGAVQRDYQLAVRRWYGEQGGQIAAVTEVPVQRIRLEGAEERATVQGLDRGVYVIQIEAEGYAKSLSPPFTIEEQDLAASVDVVLTAGGTLAGQVVDEQGRPVAGARIETQADGADDGNSLWRMIASVTPDKITRAFATTGADGRFRLSRLAFADYQLAIAHGDYCAAVRRGIAVTAAGEQDLGRLELARGAVVRGRALVDGAPRAQVKVVVTSPSTSPETTRSLLVRREAFTNNDGRFTLPGRLPPGNYELRAAPPAAGGPGADIFRQLRKLQQSMVIFTVNRGQELSEHELVLDSKT